MKISAYAPVCKSGRDFRVGPGSGWSLSKYFGPISSLHTNVFLQLRTFLSSVTAEAIGWLNLQWKMIKCELLSHVYFATPSILCSCAYIDSLGKFGVRPHRGFNNKGRARAGSDFKMWPVYNSAQLCAWLFLFNTCTKNLRFNIDNECHGGTRKAFFQRVKVFSDIYWGQFTQQTQLSCSKLECLSHTTLWTRLRNIDFIDLFLLTLYRRTTSYPVNVPQSQVQVWRNNQIWMDTS